MELLFLKLNILCREYSWCLVFGLLLLKNFQFLRCLIFCGIFVFYKVKYDMSRSRSFVVLIIILERASSVVNSQQQQQQQQVASPFPQQATFPGTPPSIITNFGTLGTVPSNYSMPILPDPTPSTNNSFQATNSLDNTVVQTPIPNTNQQITTYAGGFRSSATTMGFDLWSNNNATRKLRMGLLMANGY